LFGQTFEVQAIKSSGAVDKRINLVILSEGYQAAELPQFVTDATNFMNDMFSQTPFSQYEAYFNVYLIKVPSNESGASHPGTASDEGSVNPVVPVSSVDNYFGTSFDTAGVHRLLYSYNGSTIATVLANNFPEYDQSLILVNSPYYGGSGGMFPFSSTHADASEIAIHELGHSFVNLKDEYYPGNAQVAEAINMTQQTNPSLVKWDNWYGDNGIGIYAHGASGVAATWFRPHQTCKMRYLGYPFCSVCREGIIEKIHSLVSPIDSFTPINTTVENPTFPLDFQLDLIQPNPNTLSSNWTLNATEIATNTASVSLQESDLGTGSNSLTAVVTDTTTMLRIDNHETLHVYTVTWNIEYSLGVTDISSSENHFNIDVFPNPASSLVYIKAENTQQKVLRVELSSLDGKRIKTQKLQPQVSTSLNIETLSQGIYVLNFYDGNVLLASKRLVKN